MAQNQKPSFNVPIACLRAKTAICPVTATSDSQRDGREGEHRGGRRTRWYYSCAVHTDHSPASRVQGQNSSIIPRKRALTNMFEVKTAAVLPAGWRDRVSCPSVLSPNDVTPGQHGPAHRQDMLASSLATRHRSVPFLGKNCPFL